MKRRDLVKKLEAAGYTLIRTGDHAIYDIIRKQEDREWNMYIPQFFIVIMMEAIPSHIRIYPVV